MQVVEVEVLIQELDHQDQEEPAVQVVVEQVVMEQMELQEHLILEEEVAEAEHHLLLLLVQAVLADRESLY
jgi:hypothetical protein